MPPQRELKTDEGEQQEGRANKDAEGEERAEEEA